MSYIYFRNVETLEDLKAQYKKLAMKNHPDCGGDVETMKQINNEYDELFKRVKNVHKNAKGESYTKETDSQEVSSEFIDLINELVKMKNIVIEIIGCFVWLSGNTKPYKEKLKELGFRWSTKKKMWYKSPEGYKRYGKKDYSIDQIRGMYDSKKIKTEDEKQNRIEK